jgi:hypothetical protein
VTRRLPRLVAIALAAAGALPGWAQDAYDDVARARALLAGGDPPAAERSFARILAGGGRDVDALVGIAQARRWSGRPLAAADAAARAVRLAPDRLDAREELAWAHVDAGRPASASAAFRGVRAIPSPALRARIGELARATATVAATAYEDSNGASRVASRVALAFPVGDARLTLVGGGSRAEVGAAPLDRGVAGASLTVPLGRAELAGGWAAHRGPDEEPLYEGQLALRLAPSDGARIGVAVRRRPFVEVESLATDEAAYHAAGPGGALDPLAVARRGVDELRLSMQAAPLRGAYAYGDARGFQVTDGNRGWSAAAGAGLALLTALGARTPVDLVLRWDAYFTGFAEPRPGYFSPGFLDGHSPGVELRARAGPALELSAAGGFTWSLASDPGPGGWFAGAAITVRAGPAVVSARAEARDDPWYASRRAFVSVGTRL